MSFEQKSGLIRIQDQFWFFSQHKFVYFFDEILWIVIDFFKIFAVLFWNEFGYLVNICYYFSLFWNSYFSRHNIPFSLKTLKPIIASFKIGNFILLHRIIDLEGKSKSPSRIWRFCLRFSIKRQNSRSFTFR